MTIVMVDLETLSTRPTAAILQIGAVKFDPHGEIVPVDGPDTFEVSIDLDSCLRAGLAVDDHTFRWWLGQSSAARSAVQAQGHPLAGVLWKFHDWLGGPGIVHMPDDFELWSNGASFDVPILENAYYSLDRLPPWGHRAARDCRTLFALARDLASWEKPQHEVSHTGLADAVAQALDVQAAHRALSSARRLLDK